MPIYEYVCQACAHPFELLVRNTSTPTCPACQSSSLERKLSSFAAHTSGGSATAAARPAGCGSCGDPRGPGACSMN